MNRLEYISRDLVKDLINHPYQSPAVTIYLPTHSRINVATMNEDEIRSKNLIQNARHLIQNYPNNRSVDKSLATLLDEILNERQFWTQQTAGLLICVAPNLLRLFHLPIDTEEYVAVNDHFHLAPIFGLINKQQQYYILNVTQRQPTLYLGDMFGIRKHKINLPESLEKVLNIDEYITNTREQYGSIGASAGKKDKSFNGRGGQKERDYMMRLKFWRIIDQIILTKLNTSFPLLLAGTVKDVSEYGEISHYPNLISQRLGIDTTNDTSNQQIFEKAQAIIEQQLIKPMENKAIENYLSVQKLKPNQIANNLSEINKAAEKGKVDTLILGDIKYTADTIRSTNNVLPVLMPATVKENKHFSQLVNDIAYKIWESGGKIIDVDINSLSFTSSRLLATLRY